MTDRAWTVTTSRHVLQDRWISVRADDCVTPAGVSVAPFYVMESPVLAHVLAFDTDDRAILVRQYRHPLRILSLELPGGIVDAEDADPVAAAERELREETGYTSGHLDHLATLAPNPGRSTSLIHLVLARRVMPGMATPEPSEDIEIVLVPRAELAALACSGAIVNAAHVGLIMVGLARMTALEDSSLATLK
ncbi:NUDIX hydrolase [Methylobacterium sp. J-030]|uniref:NUDIX hydrolase n=1 Tax=Methylobacterium sp. J-030 TaxID=2836627 RepID=UPI001FB8AC7D|nr:NUDIX hydrolase [Methylobacterium sp. J-030]MCJ2069556.1 NUDIX hydrolase [Methylobacterium sp. J-030]